MTSSTIEPRSLPCLCAQTRRVDRLLNRIYDDELRPLGINTTQKSLLTNIDRWPDGASFARLGDRLAMENSTLTRNLAILESRGLTRMQIDPDDRRKRIVFLTEQGRDVLTRSESLWQDAQQRVIASLGPERARTFIELLASVEQTMRELDR